jgi:hypothetical protein
LLANALSAMPPSGGCAAADGDSIYFLAAGKAAFSLPRFFKAGN